MRQPSTMSGPTPSLLRTAVVVAAICGAVVAAQGRLNGDLSTAGAGALVASWLSYVGTLGTVVVAVVARGTLRSTGSLLRRDGRWWWYAVGTFGIPIVLAMTVGVPVVGVAIASVCAVAGQTVSGLVLDARGVGVPEPLRPTRRRLVAGIAAVAGLAVAVLAGSSDLDSDLATVIGIGLALFAGGVALGGQQAGNGKVTSLAGDPVVAGLTTATGGTVVISAIVGVVAMTGGLGSVALPSVADNWQLYLGGPLGAVITVGAAWAVRHLGTFGLTLAIVGGQMAAAIVLDVVGGVGVHGATLLAASMIVGATVAAVGRAGQSGAGLGHGGLGDGGLGDGGLGDGGQG